MSRLRGLLVIIGPGLLVAATGVGAGDLATASFAGSQLGVAILWAVVLGAFLKFVMNEGLARWQLATGSTLVEGCVERFGQVVAWMFLAYLVVWSFLVGAALMSAIGVTGHAIYPLFGPDGAQADRIVYGLLHSLVAVALVWIGGYRLFEKVMSGCIAVMFVVVIATAIALRPEMSEIVAGLAVPLIPEGGVQWTIALMGGVGGTVTVLCYGYWIREEGRRGTEDLTVCRVDLAVGYLATAVFGLAMVVIGSSLGPMTGGGASLLRDIATQLETALGGAGPVARWVFLIGAWAAIFSSLLGVWQATPYIFADLWSLLRHGRREIERIDTTSLPYRAYLLAIALLPAAGLMAFEFRTMQKFYGIVGALFVPMLAAVLLALNSRGDWVGREYRNSRLTAVVLAGTLLFFIAAGVLEMRDQLWPAGE